MLPALLLLAPALLAPAAASPLHADTEDREDRGAVDEALGSLASQFRDSNVYPLILNPLAVNKLHCGSVVTFYDTSSADDATVAVDICLTAFIIAKAFVLWTLVSEGVQLDRLDGGVFAILDTITEAVAKLDLAGSGPEGEPFADVAANKDSDDGDYEDASSHEQPGYAYVPALAPQKTGEQNYHGFGLNSWQSGPQAFPDISNLYNGDLARAFGGAASSSQVGDLVRATLQQLDRAVSVTTKEE